MVLIEEYDGSCIDDMSIEQFEESSDGYNVFGDPEVFPRVGDEYQVEIPQLISEYDLALYKSNPSEVENRADMPFNFLIGLPIPLIWINQEVGTIKHKTTEVHGYSESSSKRYGSFKSESVKKTCFCSENIKTEPSENVEASSQSINPAFEVCGGCRLVPGFDDDSWSNNEKGSFLLGVYIFEKNFFQVKRFVESKGMGDILSFYYGKFCRSREYGRWSDCRKMKSKKVVYGEKLFTGLRQQELLCRLFPTVSEECQNAISEVSKTFGEGRMSLEDYVFSLKAMVGTNILVEAVGIGKGKKDLTSMALEPSRTNQTILLRSEIPTGKACADLEPREIIKFLTGDYRLSKARASDLFWEAVWPRLLARGWQSEQPKNEGKESLVFLVPGIKRFSRRKLEKGKQYFDSITDVLAKVASEPALLELDSEVGKGNEREEDDELTRETKEKQDDTPTRSRHCYLQPRTPNRNTSTMKFTVVDTSLMGGKPYKVRELRSLTVEASSKLILANHSENSNRSTSEVSNEESDTVNAMLVDQSKTNVSKSISNGNLPERNNHGSINPKRESYSTKGRASSSSNIRKSYDDKVSRKVIECHSSQQQKRKSVDNVAPITKRRRRLKACSNPETNNTSSKIPISEPEIPICCSGDNDVLSLLASSQDKLSSTISTKGCQTKNTECGRHSTSHVAEHLREGRPQIDLNLLPVNPDFEDGIVMTESVEEPEEQDDRSNQMPEDDKKSSGLQPETSSRRQSTRNRPPTVRALEAMANGFLSVSSRPRKNKETSSLENYTSRTSRRPRTGAGVTDSSAGSMESTNDEGGSDAYNGGGSNVSGKPQLD